MNEKRRYNFLIFASTFLWIIMMGSKNVYTAELVEIMQVFDVNKAQANLAMTYYFITYSATQIIFFFILDRINIKWYMFISIFLSGIVTALVASVTGMWQLWWLLSLNGILQAGVWGMCLSVFNKLLPKSMHPKANAAMNVGMAVAGIISYGSASLFVGLGRWNLPFIILGAILSLSAVLYFIAIKLCENVKQTPEKSTEITRKTPEEKIPFTLETKSKKAVFYIITFLLSLTVHIVYYATLNWLPNLITENYGLDNSAGILVSVLAPLSTVIGPIIAIKRCEKSDFIKTGIIYLFIATVFALLRIFLFDFNLTISLIVIIVFLIFAQACITIICSVVSYKTGKLVNAGAHAGLMNAAGGCAAGLAPTVMGAVLDATNNDWQFSCTLIFILSAAITASVIFIALSVKRKKTRLKLKNPD